MNILLLSMPDSFEHMPSIVIRMPNGALSSLAGNIDPHHRVAVADLIPGLHRRIDPRSSVMQVLLISVGIAVITFAERHAH